MVRKPQLKKESVLLDRRSAEAEARISEPQASGAVGGEVLQIPNEFPEPAATAGKWWSSIIVTRATW